MTKCLSLVIFIEKTQGSESFAQSDRYLSRRDSCIFDNWWGGTSLRIFDEEGIWKWGYTAHSAYLPVPIERGLVLISGQDHMRRESKPCHEDGCCDSMDRCGSIKGLSCDDQLSRPICQCNPDHSSVDIHRCYLSGIHPKRITPCPTSFEGIL